MDMRDTGLEQLINIDPNSNHINGRELRNDSSKNFSSNSRKNSSFRQLSNIEGPNTERHRCSSVISRSKRQKSDIENLENVSMHMPHIRNIDLNQSMIPIMPLYLPKEKDQILAQVNKSKAIKLKAFMKVQDAIQKKITDDLYPLQKVFHSKGIRKSEDSKNCLSSMLSQSSQRGFPSSLQNKIAPENNIITQKQEKFLLDHETLLNNIKRITLHKKSLGAALKDHNHGSQNTQRLNSKSIDTSFPNNTLPKKDISQKNNPNKYLKDLEILKTTLKPHVSLKPGSGMLLQIGVRPVKGHKRGLSMDQVLNSSTKSIIQSQNPNQHLSSSKKSSGIVEANNIPQPSQSNQDYEDETRFYEEFFSTSKMTFEFEKLVIAQRNKRKTETKSAKSTSKVNAKPTSVHTRTRSIEEYRNSLHNKTHIRWNTKRLSCPDESGIIKANFS